MKKIILLIITSVFAFANIGKITSVRGDVIIQRDTQSIKAVSGLSLYINDTIKTKAKAKSLILFNDKTSITIGSKSTFIIKDYSFNKKIAKNSKANFYFGTGMFRTITGKIGKLNRDGFKITTSSGTIGIRGSDGTTVVSDNGNIQHTVHHGAFVMTDTKSGQTVFIPSGSTGKIKVNSGISVAISTKDDLKATSDEKENKADKKEIKKEDKKETNKEDKKEDKKETNKEDKKEDKKETKKEDKADKKRDRQETRADKKRARQEANADKKRARQEARADKKEIRQSTISTKLAILTEDTNNIPEQAPAVKVPEVEVPEVEAHEEETIYNAISSEEKYIGHRKESDTLVSKTATIDFTSATKKRYGNNKYFEYGFVHINDNNDRVYATTTNIIPSEKLDNIINNKQTASYSGGVAAYVGIGDNAVESGGSIHLDFDFSKAEKNRLTGGKIIITEGNYRATILSGRVNSDGFKASKIEQAADSTGNVEGGYVVGSFYGDNAQEAGGKFQLNDKYIRGAFGTKKD